MNSKHNKHQKKNYTKATDIIEVLINGKRENILKAARGGEKRYIIYKGTKRKRAVFSLETIKMSRL